MEITTKCYCTIAVKHFENGLRFGKFIAKVEHHVLFRDTVCY